MRRNIPFCLSSSELQVQTVHVDHQTSVLQSEALWLGSNSCWSGYLRQAAIQEHCCHSYMSSSQGCNLRSPRMRKCGCWGRACRPSRNSLNRQCQSTNTYSQTPGWEVQKNSGTEKQSEILMHCSIDDQVSYFTGNFLNKLTTMDWLHCDDKAIKALICLSLAW